MKLAVLFLCLSIGVFVRPSGAQSQQEEEPEANPGRPTIATPATLTPVGYFQFETGFLGASDSPEFSSRYSMNEVMKLAVVSRLELLLEMEPVVHFTAGDTTATHVSGVSVGAQGLLYKGEGAKPSLGVSYLRSVYNNGNVPDLDYGSPTNSALILVSADVKGFHYDFNLFFNELVQGPVRRAQFGQTLSISHPLPHGFGLTGEIWHYTQPFLQSNTVGNLWAVSYQPNKTLVFDAGFNRGLTGTSTRWEAFCGFTYLLPHRLWRAHAPSQHSSPGVKGPN